MKVIIIGCNVVLTRIVICSLIERKVNFTLIGTKEVISLVSKSRLCKGTYKIEQNDFHENNEFVLNIIEKIIPNNEECYIIPSCIDSTLFLSKYNKGFKSVSNTFPISDYKTIMMLNNKWDFYQFLKELNFPVPKSILVNESTDIIRGRLNFPIIIKPTDLEGGMGVKRLDTQEELNDTIKKYKTPIIIQEYIEGSDFNLGIISIKGEVVASVIHKNTRELVEFKENEVVLELGKKIVKELSFSGIIHFDMRIDEEKGSIKILECNPRVWGSMIHVLYSGSNFIQLLIDAKGNRFEYSQISHGTFSLTIKAILVRTLKLSLNKKDIESLFKRIKYYRFDPVFEFFYLMYLFKVRIINRIKYQM